MSVPVPVTMARCTCSPAIACSTRPCWGRRRAASATTPTFARRVHCARDVDDLEVRAAADPLRRRKGRHPLQPARNVRDRARADDSPLHDRAAARDRARGGHPGSGHGHERADDGLDHGHVLDGGGLRGARDCDGKAGLDRWLRLPPRGHRRRRRHGRRARLPATRLGAHGAALRCPGLRERRRCGRARARGARCPGMAVSDISGGVYSEAGLDLAALDGWIEDKARSTATRTPSMSDSDLLELPCDVLVLAALEDQITAENVGRIEAGWSRRGRTGRRPSTPTRSSPSAASSSSRTS